MPMLAGMKHSESRRPTIRVSSERASAASVRPAIGPLWTSIQVCNSALPSHWRITRTSGQPERIRRSRGTSTLATR